jgi:hypothetical protein
VPSYGGDGELGGVIRVPYFINISPTQDATLTPIVTTKEGLALLAEYRNRFSGGLFVGDGSATYASKEDGTDGFRGHFDGRLNVEHTISRDCVPKTTPARRRSSIRSPISTTSASRVATADDGASTATCCC